MTRTDRILAAVREELIRHAPELDGDGGIRVVMLTIRLNERTGNPYAIVYRAESEHAIDSRSICVVT